MFRKIFSGAACVLALISTSAMADHKSGKTMPTSHAPIGVMGDHFHDEGEVMLSYRHSRMLMKGMKDGESSITPSAIVAAGGAYGYMMTPTRMSMDMHMLGAMYAPSNDLTLMLMGHYMDKNMDMINRLNVRSKMDTQGWGDTVLSALYRIFEKGCDCGAETRLHATFGLSLPTGSTDEKGMRMGAYGNLPYAMQLGSGTFDPILGLTYASENEEYAWGAQAKATFRFGDNDDNWRLGNEYKATLWGAKNMSDWLSASLRIEGTHKGDISGSDANTIGFRAMVPTFDPDNYGGTTVDLGVGFNILFDGDLKGHRLAFEYTTPVFEDLNGPQMSSHNTFWVGWQYAF